MSHTPGPWTHHPADNIILDAAGKRLIEWQARSLDVPTTERDANAALIAAAPELLDALRMVLDDPESLAGRPRTEEYVRAAISKAEGR